MEYNSYDINLKLKVCEEYLNTNISYGKLANKYNVNKSTVVSWIRRYKANNELVPLRNDVDLYRVSPEELIENNAISNEKEIISINLNGIEISTDSKGIKAIMEVILK